MVAWSGLSLIFYDTLILLPAKFYEKESVWNMEYDGSSKSSANTPLFLLNEGKIHIKYFFLPCHKTKYRTICNETCKCYRAL